MANGGKIPDLDRAEFMDQGLRSRESALHDTAQGLVGNSESLKGELATARTRRWSIASEQEKHTGLGFM